MWLGKELALGVANGAIVLFMRGCLFHYAEVQHRYILYATILSSMSALIFINSKELQTRTFYHYGLPDNTVLLQGLLVLTLYYIQKIC